MNAGRITHQLRVLWRTDRIVAELRLRRLLRSLGLRALAAVVASFALLCFELAAYFALIWQWGAIGSAAALGGINLALAALLLFVASRRPAERELTLATDMHRAALDALEAEVRTLQGSAQILRTGFENVAIPVLLPLVSMLLRRLRRSASPTEPSTD